MTLIKELIFRIRKDSCKIFNANFRNKIDIFLSVYKTIVLPCFGERKNGFSL